MRKDAERNRERLIEAASAVMRTDGSDAPMEVIADQAGLTRGTLYRNFPHRQAMYEAVLERDLENLARLLEEDRSDDLAFIRHMAELMMVYDKFLIQLADMPDYEADKNDARMIAVLAPYLASAQGSGALRGDLVGSDVLVACRMLASHWKLDSQNDFKTAFAPRLKLLLHGMSARDAILDGERE